MSHQITRRSVIRPTMACNANCTFCYYKGQGCKSSVALQKIKRTLIIYKQYYGLENVDISGGEPTIYPDIAEMVSFSSRIGLKPTIITNALKPSVLAELAAGGLDDAIISLHNTGKKHDKAVGRQGAGRKLFESVGVLKKYGTSFRTNTTITSQNYKSLPAISKELVKLGPKMVNFIVFNPCRESVWSRNKNVAFQARYGEIAPYLKEAIDELSGRNIWANVRYMPLCVMRGYEKHVCNFKQLIYDPYEWTPVPTYSINRDSQAELAKRARRDNIYGTSDYELLCNYIIEHNLLGLKIYADKDRRISREKRGMYGNKYPEKCTECVNYNICDGIYWQYERSFGLDDFVPVAGKKHHTDPLAYRSKDTRWRK